MLKHKLFGVLSLFAISALTLTACAPESAGGSASSTTASASEAGSENTAGSNSAPDEDKQTTEEQPAEVKADPRDCLVGDWHISEAELQKFYDTVNVSEATFTVKGDMGLSFTADEYEFQPDFTFTLDISGIEGVGEIVGLVQGSYTATEEILTTEYENADQVDFIITVMGQEFDGKEINDSFLSMFAINEAPYECVDNTLTLGYQDVTGQPVVPVVYERR
ncbi:MAG TPA: hypothetical protein VLZ31_02755 [Microbacteriaceae bacterium]|nr:hypothetical protein [Microbacteriaceae bacterium]